MKIIIAPLLAFTLITFSSLAFAYNEDWEDQYGYERGHACSACVCTDPGYHWNTCINKAEYCENFGNTGGWNDDS